MEKETATLDSKFRQLQADVNSLFVDRNEEVEVAVTSLLAKEHCCFLGDPGIAKSAVIEELVKRIAAPTKYFWIQLFGETPPTDVFGQMSLKALREQDINKRNVEGHLPTAHIAFMDEIFQARSTILVGCNSIMQERKYMNGCAKVDTPLITMFGASNFYPEDPQLCALWDRFIARKYVKGLSSSKSVKKMLNLPRPPVNPDPVVGLMELGQAHKAVDNVTVPASVIDSFVELITQLKGLDNPIEVSDRRKCKAMKFLQARAFLSGRQEADTCDFGVLRYILWTKPDEIAPLEELLERYVPADPVLMTGLIDALRPNIDAAMKLKGQGDMAEAEFAGAAGELLGKVNDALKTLKEQSTLVKGHAPTRKIYKGCLKQLAAWQQDMMNAMRMPVEGFGD